VIEALISYATKKALNVTVPSTSDRQQSGRIPDGCWSDFAKPLRGVSPLWHRIWNDRSRPRLGVVADLIRDVPC
jgi:hypothetical protein